VVAVLEAENVGLRAESARLRAENADLRRRAGMNSENSLIPSSKDRPAAKARRGPVLAVAVPGPQARWRSRTGHRPLSRPPGAGGCGADLAGVQGQ
jgi:hypothetical protein